MDGEIIAAIVFISLVALFSIIKRKSFKTQGFFPLGYIALYRTKLGVLLMDKLAKKFPRFWKIFGDIGIAIGFLGMGLVTWTLISYLIHLISAPKVTEHVITLVLPFSIKGMFYVPFSYWIISIIVVASIHELMHGVIGRAYGMKIKSSGFAFLSILIPLIPAAFVEPDEKQLAKKPVRQQLAMFAAGSVTNIIFTVFFLFMLVVSIPTDTLIVNNGVTIQSFDSYSPAKDAGFELDDRIIAIGDGAESGKGGSYYQIHTNQDLYDALQHYKPNSTINVFATRDGEFALFSSKISHVFAKSGTDPTLFMSEMTLTPTPANHNVSYLGISVHGSTGLKDEIKQKYGTFLPNVLIWFNTLLYWLYVLSLGIGLMNLAPILPLDGGRMMQLVMFKIFKKKRRAKLASGIISIVLIGCLLLSLVLGYVL